MSAVLDASAILALLANEPGAAAVQEHLFTATVSAVNLAEAASKLSDRGMSDGDVRAALTMLGFTIAPFDEDAAYASAALRRQTRAAGLSLGDRACLALGIARKMPVLTADRAWAALPIGAKVKVIREC